MTATKNKSDYLELQAAITRVALALDAFLVNGIPNGVLNNAVFDGFLAKAAGSLLDQLTELEESAKGAPVPSRAKTDEDLAALRTRCQQLIDLVTGLISFRTLPLAQVRAAVSRIAPLRAECMSLVEKVEAQCQTPEHFYQSRPSHSTTSLIAFLANLDAIFVQDWNASRG
jgi:hypothetical protein